MGLIRSESGERWFSWKQEDVLVSYGFSFFQNKVKEI